MYFEGNDFRSVLVCSQDFMTSYTARQLHRSLGMLQGLLKDSVILADLGIGGAAPRSAKVCGWWLARFF